MKCRSLGATICAICVVTPWFARANSELPSPSPATPIEHVIIVIGENRTFDHVFATYRPHSGETVDNLLSREIITADGKPGPNFAQARQFRDEVRGSYGVTSEFKTPYETLPPLMTAGAAPFASDTDGPPLLSRELARRLAPGLPDDAVGLLLTGATNLPRGSIDTRFQHGERQANGPFALTPGLPYDSYSGDQVHRFYQMWQQMDCSVAMATAANPSGCLMDLLPWVETTVGKGSNGKPQASDFNELSTGEGATSMGFYNIALGDAPYLKRLADQYALADNYHQAILGGTGANHIAIGTGDAIWFSNDKDEPATPPSDQIENPNPQPGTNNFYTQDGYQGGSYSECADHEQPGVGSILDYLASLPSHPAARCAAGHYYLLNNYAPGYFGDGTVNRGKTAVVPPSPLRTIGDALSERHLRWRYYGEGWNAYQKDPKSRLYCDICNPFQYTHAVMTDPAGRQEHLKDLPDFYADIANGTLPAVSFVKPNDLNDGHPGSSKLDIFEAFSRKLIDAVQKKPALWKHTAIIITFDEGGGLYDSGYIQPVDFFGDGPRIPTIVVSPYSTGGHVIHTYYDHVSLLKFIERNWHLAPLTERSRDNLPNPNSTVENPYVPSNSPAIGDLMEMFHF